MWLVALLGLMTAALAPIQAFAEDVEPKVSPDRIEDVPSTRPDPFPAFDNFSWRAFIALAWPARLEAAHRGEPDRSKSLADPGPRVWETFKSRYEIFQPAAQGAAAPAAWSSYGGKNPCGSNIGNDVKTLSSFDLFSDFNQAGLSPGAFVGPLVAQNRTYTRYETRVNEAEFDSIVDHEWFRRRFLPSPDHPGTFNEGSIAIKAAWRFLTDQDTPAVRRRYYVVRDAEVLDVAKTLELGLGVCSKQDVALVGLHIVVKTRYRPQGIWSSFEHVDNVPPVGTGDAREPDAKEAGAPYSYSDALAAKASPPVATGGLSALPVSATNPPKIDPQPTQVARLHPIGAETMAMNRAYWALPGVRGTVWSHYMLVATQWPTLTQPVSPQNDGAYFPGTPAQANAPAEIYQLAENGGDKDRNLANTTMETYFQDPATSCMSCHHAVSNALGRDFVAFIAQDAR
ncbi:MAG TPA: hypothetical protein VKS78_01260 [Roseiarcus sp.]|nr:hypothetical protein [Roseiarcus sp.]